MGKRAKTNALTKLAKLCKASTISSTPKELQKPYVAVKMMSNFPTHLESNTSVIFSKYLLSAMAIF